MRAFPVATPAALTRVRVAQVVWAHLARVQLVREQVVLAQLAREQVVLVRLAREQAVLVQLARAQVVLVQLAQEHPAWAGPAQARLRVLRELQLRTQEVPRVCMERQGQEQSHLAIQLLLAALTHWFFSCTSISSRLLVL